MSKHQTTAINTPATDPSLQRPLALSDEQLDQVYRTAGTVPVHLRDTFLERLADLLSGKPLGDGFVYRCCREASYGLVEYAYEEAPELRRRTRSKVGAIV